MFFEFIVILLAAMVREDVIFLQPYHQFVCIGTDSKCFPVPVPCTDVRLVREDVIFLQSYHQLVCLGTDRKCFPVPVPRTDVRLVRESVNFLPSYQPGIKNILYSLFVPYVICCIVDVVLLLFRALYCMIGIGLLCNPTGGKYGLGIVCSERFCVL